MLHPNYPKPGDVDALCQKLFEQASGMTPRVELLDSPALANGHPVPRNVPAGRYVRFEREGASPYFGLWQPVASGGPAPLLVHLPGYGAEMSMHPPLVAAGFNVLHVSPLGYCTPTGFDVSKRKDKPYWPVLPDTIVNFGQCGYPDWLTDAIVAVNWAKAQPQVQADRVAIFGTSQGGGTALLLASILQGQGVRAVCADEPFLTGFTRMFSERQPGAYVMAKEPLQLVQRQSPDRLDDAWRALGHYDTLSHAHRLTMPTLLTAGGKDASCPAHTIRALFERLPATTTRSYTELADAAHGYTAPFGELVLAWCRLYV